MKQRIEHHIPISADRFWSSLFFSPQYVQEEHIEGLSCQEYRVIEESSGPPNYNRTLFSVPPLNIPKSLQKVVGNRIGYTEKGFFDTKKQQYHFTLTPTIFPSKISIHGFYFIETINESTINRVCELDSSVSIFAVGKKMEEAIAQSNIDIQQKTAHFSAVWLARQH
jgi:hypothetical protein